jgi:hypothetical protein
MDMYSYDPFSDTIGLLFYDFFTLYIVAGVPPSDLFSKKMREFLDNYKDKLLDFYNRINATVSENWSLDGQPFAFG